MALPKLQIVKIENGTIPNIYPRILAVKIENDTLPKIYPRVLAIKIENDKTFSNLMYTGKFYTGKIT